MTIPMPDSITPGNIPMDAAAVAVLGYCDGNFKTDDRLPVLFPKAKRVILTVTGVTTDADGCDSERGDLGAASAAAWVRRKLAASPGSRPVIYASVQGEEGFGMPWVLAELAALGIARASVRLLTAHYGQGQHICSPGACGAKFSADGTQWTDQFPGVNGTKIDMSLLRADWFGDPAGWTFAPVRGLDVEAIGPHSVRLSWSAPGVPAPEAVDHYQVTIRHQGGDVTGFPADVTKGDNPESHQFNGLRPATGYEALVRAVAVGGHASAWASVTFTTPAALRDRPDRRPVRRQGVPRRRFPRHPHRRADHGAHVVPGHAPTVGAGAG